MNPNVRIGLEKVINLISTPRTPAEALFLSDTAVLAMEREALFLAGEANTRSMLDRPRLDVYNEIFLFVKVKEAFEIWAEKAPLYAEHVFQVKKNLERIRVQILALQLFP